ARGSDRQHPFDTWVEPHDTDTSQPLLRGHSNQREGEAIQRVCGISHFYRIGGKCCELERGILMYSFSLSPDTGSVAGRRPAPLARASLRPRRDSDSVAVPPHSHTKPGPPGPLQSAPATADAGGARSPWSGSTTAGRDRDRSPGG